MMEFDVIVIGAGHAGVEAAVVASKLNVKTLLLTLNLDNIAKASCNPSIGGVGKSQLVYEIDALGGLMGKLTNLSWVQMRMLNKRKGLAVWSLRAQIDRFLYRKQAKEILEKINNLYLLQGRVVEILFERKRNKKIVKGVKLSNGLVINSKAIVYTPGTFPNGLILIGNLQIKAGRMSEEATGDIISQLKILGYEIGRLKTGTPPRIRGTSINKEKVLIQKSDDEEYSFSYWTKRKNIEPMVCYETYLTEEGSKFIFDNVDKSALFSGKVEGIGPRYCPSIEDKVVRFGVKKHLVYLEPEGFNLDEYYVQGMSTSLPIDIQYEYLKKIRGLENVIMTRPGYAIEYDFVLPHQLLPSLQLEDFEGLYLAGQVNGTSGYEEAAAQGLVAGMNAALFVKGEKEIYFTANDGYIGTLINDLMNKKIVEPYRMFTSRVAKRLSLRWDNAWLRFYRLSKKLKLLNIEEEKLLDKWVKQYNDVMEFLKKGKIKLSIEEMKKYGIGAKRQYKNTLEMLVNKNFNEIREFLNNYYSEKIEDVVLNTLLIDLKYHSYIEKEEKEYSILKSNLDLRLDLIDYEKIEGLSFEGREKLIKYRPKTIQEASKIDGVKPSDLMILIKYLTSK